jgi:hypothetical protein
VLISTRHEDGEGKLQSFLTSALGTDEWPALLPGSSTPRKESTCTHLIERWVSLGARLVMESGFVDTKHVYYIARLLSKRFCVMK